MPEALEIIDSHHHLLDLSLHKYSWCSQVPELNRSFLMSEYLEEISKVSASAKIVKAVHVEVDVDEPFMAAETQWVLEQAEANDNCTVAVVGCCRAEHPAEKFRAFIEQFAGNPRYKGVRRLLQDQPDELSQSSVFIENVRSLVKHQLTFDFGIVPGQIPVAAKLARACPEVSFVLDHCGGPLVKDQIFEPWRTDIRDIAKLPNVVCKISGIVAYGDGKNWKPADLRPYVEHVIEQFGWDRVMFGSDWPVCTLGAPLGKWVATLMELTASASRDERERLFRRNAERVYRLV